MSPEARTDCLFNRAIKLGLINPTTGEGAPTREMVSEEISYAASTTELEDLAMSTRRLIVALRKYDPSNKLASQTVEQLRCIGLIKPTR